MLEWTKWIVREGGKRVREPETTRRRGSHFFFSGPFPLSTFVFSQNTVVSLKSNIK